jgi:hypothetical protein
MFLKVRMLNRQQKWILIIIAVGSILAFISYYTESSTVCPLRQLSIVSQIQNYGKTQDPQTCDMLNTKISQFNSECKSDVEELDCG